MNDGARFPFQRAFYKLTLPGQTSPFIRSYGRALCLDPGNQDSEQKAVAQLQELAIGLGLKKLFWPRPANARQPSGRWCVVNFPLLEGQFVWRSEASTDGVILDRPDQAVVFATSDCPTAILWSTKGGPVAVLHCGREALHGADVGQVEHSVIHNTLSAYGLDWGHSRHWRACITLGIAGRHFTHKKGQDQIGTWSEVIKELVKTYGADILVDQDQEALDLTRLILNQLKGYGLKESQVHLDGLDTYSDARLASYRRWAMEGRPPGRLHNLVVVKYPW